MTYAQLNERLHEVLTDLGIDQRKVADGAHFNRDLGLDSLDTTNLLLQVEIYFSIRIPDEDWWKLKTIGQLRAYLASEVLFDGNYVAW